LFFWARRVGVGAIAVNAEGYREILGICEGAKEDKAGWSVADGARLGLVGHNGAGKTTPLRVLSRIYRPTAGAAVIDGECVSLINISLGIDPEATGRENIRLCAAIMGMTPTMDAFHADDKHGRADRRDGADLRHPVPRADVRISALHLRRPNLLGDAWQRPWRKQVQLFEPAHLRQRGEIHASAGLKNEMGAEGRGLRHCLPNAAQPRHKVL
jgi:energy-coupling factor transporter ATP-binding protein EcfA2